MLNKKQSTTQLDWSVIIVNYRSRKYLKEAIASLLQVERETKLSWEIIVVDNHSPKEESKKIKNDWRHEPRAQVIVSKNNLGFGGANNLGAQKAKGKYLFFLNPDTLCNEELLEELKTLLTREGCGVVAPKLMLPNNCPQLYSSDQFPTLGRTLSSKFLSQNDNHPTKTQALRPVDWVSGAAMAMEKTLFEQIGGFDERFFMYFEDVDLCRRVATSGRQNYVAENLSVVHLGGERTVMTKARREKYFAGQNQYFQKHRPQEYKWLRIIRRGYEWWCQKKDQ